MQFNPLEYPTTFLEPVIPNFNSAWIEHIPFAFTLIEAMRPSRVVELGVHTGALYCSFCRAVDELKLPTKCFGVDTWQGDPHAGMYESDVLKALQGFHDPKFSSFSTLMKMDFDSGAAHFEQGSIDLLHIDGLHTYDAVKHDFETWLPKMSESGVILFHDTIITRDDFGVYQLWAELAGRYPHFQFEHGSGLGVLAVGSNVPSALAPIFGASSAQAVTIRNFYSRLGREIDLRRYYSAVVHQVFQGQNLINQWKQQVGQPVAPQTQNMQLALENGAAFAQNLAAEIHRLASADLMFRRQVQGGGVKPA